MEDIIIQIVDEGTINVEVIDDTIVLEMQNPRGDALEIELQTTATYIQWRYIGGEWLNLIALSEITGPAGEDGTDGTNGREVELQKGTTYIQWRYVGDVNWINLVALADLKGDKGDKGDEAYDIISEAEIDAGISTDARVITAQRLKYQKDKIINEAIAYSIAL